MDLEEKILWTLWKCSSELYKKKKKHTEMQIYKIFKNRIFNILGCTRANEKHEKQK